MTTKTEKSVGRSRTRRTVEAGSRRSSRFRTSPLISIGIRPRRFSRGKRISCWLQKDPIGFKGGINLYGYVGNEPVVLVDCLGNTPVDTGVSTCFAWGPHWFIKIDGQTIGFGAVGGPSAYAGEGASGVTSSFSGSSSSSSSSSENSSGSSSFSNSSSAFGASSSSKVFGDVPGAISSPDRFTKPGQGSCTSIKLDDCKYDIDAFKECVRSNANSSAPNYNLLNMRCDNWVDGVYHNVNRTHRKRNE